MTCHETRELFSARVDEALTPEERSALEAHLAGCPECRRELARFEGTVALLRQVAPARAPVGFVDRVLAAAQPSPWYARLWQRLSQPLAWKRPMEATVVVIVAVTAVYLYQRTPELRRETRPEVAYQASRPAPSPIAPAAPAPLPSSRAEPSRAAPLAPREQAQPTPSRDVEKDAPRTAERKEQPVTDALTSTGRAGETPPASGSEKSAAPAQAPAPEARTGALEDARKRSLARSDASKLAAKVAPADLAGRLAVADRAGAERALESLLTRLGSTDVSRRHDAEALVVDATVPGAAYADLLAGLAEIGRWQPDRVPAGPLPRLRVSLRIAD